MNTGDVVKITWLDSGLHMHDHSEAEALEAELPEVTCYGRVVAVREAHVVICHEEGRGDVGTYGAILRACILDTTILERADSRHETRRLSRLDLD